MDVISFEFPIKDKEPIIIFIEDSEESPKFKIQGPKEIIHKAIGGIGFENQESTITTATEEHLNTEAKRMFAVLQTLKIAFNKK